MTEQKQVTLGNVKDDLLSRPEWLEEIEAIGIFGSLARGDFGERSDIDVFVVLDGGPQPQKIDDLWWNRIHDLLREYPRDKTVIVYTIRALKEVCNWYVLRLATEGLIVYDRGVIAPLFRKIVAKARACGLVEKEYNGRKVWEMERQVKSGETIEIRITDDQ